MHGLTEPGVAFVTALRGHALWHDAEFMRRAIDATSIVLGGLVAGFVVGLADGIHAGLAVGVGTAGVVFAGLLAAAVDLWLGIVMAMLVVLVRGLARWGRRRHADRGALITAWLLLGAGAAAITVRTVVATALRGDRFLAAGVAALDVVVLGVAAALLAPALARLLAPLVTRLYPRIARAARAIGRRAPAKDAPVVSDATEPNARSPVTPTGLTALDSDPWQSPPSAAGLFWFSPLVTVALASAVFLLVWKGPAPLIGSARVGRLLLIGFATTLLPAALALVSGRIPRVRARIAVPIGLLIWTALAIWFARAHWDAHLRFVPWRDLRIIGFVAAGGALVMTALAWLGPGGAKRAIPVLLAPPAALALLLLTGANEKARKATTSAGGIVGPLLGMVRPALDFDADGYPGLLGGGDCDDRNPRVNPAAEDWPEDGIDEDCDGADVRAADLRPPPPHPVPASVPRDLNILLIVIDSLRADRLGAYGYDRPTSPELDRLALEGTVFTNAWAHAPSTRDSMPAIFTGRWPSAIVWDTSLWWPGIARGQRTLAEALRRSNYFNGAYFAHSYFARADARGFERGVDQYDDRLAAKHIGSDQQSAGSSAREMADDGIDFLRAYRDQKFFLALHFYDPHLAWQPHKGAPSFGRKPADLYDGEIWFTDRQIGRVLAALRELGLHDKTAIVVTSDHGESLGEHGTVAHGTTLFAEQTKVPLIVRVPGLSPRRVTAPVGHVDIAPTLLNLARARPEPSFVGRSLLDLVARSDAGSAPEAVFQETTFESRTPAAMRPLRRALATATHHLIWKVVPENTVSCFDLVHDPREQQDLWGLPAGEAACPELKRALDRKLSLLKLAGLPSDFAARLGEGVFAPGKVAPPPRFFRRAQFGDSVRFLGYDAEIRGVPFPSLGPPPIAAVARNPADEAPIRIARGGEVVVTTHYEVQRDPTGWRIFFHLDGPGGTRNLDHTPVFGAAPVERWRRGQTIRDRFSIRFGPGEAPGLHTLSIGFWQPPSSARKRLRVAPPHLQDGQDRLRVLSFEVE